MKDQVFNVPNILTFFRLALIPVTLFLIASEHMMWALGAFVTACFTDVLDGWIARRHALTTRLGTWLDPFADKLMAVCVVIAFMLRGILPWFVMVVLFLKELLMLVGGAIILKNGNVTPSNRYGKFAALLLNVSIGAGFFYQYWYPYYLWAIYVAMVFVLFAFFQYARLNWHLLFGKSKKSVDEEE